MNKIADFFNNEDRFSFLESMNLSLPFKKQLSLLRLAINENVSFSTVLKAHSLSYDDLVYLETTKFEFNNSYLSLDDFQDSKNKSIPAVSFFSGAGGLDLGFEALAFSHEMLIEKVPLFCETLKHNRPSWEIYSGDVSKTDEVVNEIEKRIGVSSNFEGVFLGGPPCQPFSIAANQRYSKNGDNFKRVGFSHETNGNLLFDYIELIKKFRPKVFLIENVVGLQEVDGGEQLKLAYDDLANSGYRINPPMILNASYYHVPQQRIRLFVIGARSDSSFEPLMPTVSQTACGGVFNRSLEGADNHITREHSAESIFRYMQLSFGKRDQLGRVDRLNPNKPSKTIIAGGSKGGGRSHLHPYIPRTLSVRESARLQTFPDDYIFTGPVARQFTQVGNAVPPVLAAQIAKAIRKSYF